MVSTGPLVGLISQTLLVAVLAVTVGIGWLGWVVGISYGLVTCLALNRGLRSAGADRLGPADRITLARAVLVGGVTVLTVGPSPTPVLVAMASVALALDAVDGLVARRTGTRSNLGARFDMEVDAFLILVLSVRVALDLGPWVLAIGAMRYVYVAAGAFLPWLRSVVPPRYWRKVVAAVQGIVLTAVTSGLFPRPVTVTAVAAALALLVESFGRDIVWQWAHRSGV
jgi:phosphatidylglycerophosphate synthase